MSREWDLTPRLRRDGYGGLGTTFVSIKIFSKSREWDLNPRPADYESAALPLSYLGDFWLWILGIGIALPA